MAWLFLVEGWPRDAQIRFLVLLGTCGLLAVLWICAQQGKFAALRALVVVQMELRETKTALDEEVRLRLACASAGLSQAPPQAPRMPDASPATSKATLEIIEPANQARLEPRLPRAELPVALGA